MDSKKEIYEHTQFKHCSKEEFILYVNSSFSIKEALIKLKVDYSLASTFKLLLN